MAVKYEIKTKIGIISEKSSGWSKELNIVSWNDNKPKYDIREWDENHEKMGKGITFTREELKELYNLMKNLFEDDTSYYKSISSDDDNLDILKLAED